MTPDPNPESRNPILITGVAGLVGSHLAENLLAQGRTVVGIDNFNDYYSVEQKRDNVAGFKDHERFTLYETDIRDASAAGETPVVFEEPRDEKLPHDLSPLGMFLAADWVVKSVMIGLALASLATWTILLVKGFEVFSAKWRARAGVKRLARADSLGSALGDERSAARWGGPTDADEIAARENRVGAVSEPEEEEDRPDIGLETLRGIEHDVYGP